MQTKEQKAAYFKAYYAANREKELARVKAFRVANSEKYLAQKKEYNTAHPNKNLACTHKARAEKIGAKIGDTAAILIWLNGWRTEAPVACHYCKKVSTGTDMEIDHVIPMSKGGPHDLSNLVVCCKPCNCSKYNKLPEVWLSKINL